MTTVDPEKQLQTLFDLLQQEQAYEREQYSQVLAETPLNVRCKQGISLYPLELTQQDVGLGGRPILEFKTRQSLNAFQPGQTVVLFSEVVKEQVTGVLQRVGTDWFKLYLNTADSPEWLEDGKLGLDLYYDETTWKAMFDAMRKVMNPEKPRLRTLRDILLGAQKAQFLPLRHQGPADLNESQQAALLKVLQAQDLAIVHGPPGTGKTTTLVACIQAVLQSEKQVLVCAPSNTAVDLLTRAMARAGKRVVRLGHPARMQEDVWQWTLDELTASHPNAQVLIRLRKEMLQLRRQASKFRRHFGPEERAERKEQYRESRRLARELAELEEQMIQGILDQAEVICCTLVGAGMRLLQGRHFSTVFIDEAAQAIEGACWIPILRAERVVMAGDHCQLPPTIKNPATQELARTLFEKSIACQADAGVLLNTQYRMHQAIMEFPSMQFYQGELRAHASVAQHCLAPDQTSDYALNQPIEWIDTAGCSFDEVQDPESKSYANPEEANLLRQVLEQILSDPACLTGFSIGVIAPYRQQVEALKALDWSFAASHPLNIETVDSFQGQERDLIVMSFVRSNHDGEIGFLRDLRRTNVAMTRARKKLVLIGDSATLANHKFYKELHEYVEAYGHWRSAWEFASF